MDGLQMRMEAYIQCSQANKKKYFFSKSFAIPIAKYFGHLLQSCRQVQFLEFCIIIFFFNMSFNFKALLLLFYTIQRSQLWFYFRELNFIYSKGQRTISHPRFNPISKTCPHQLKNLNIHFYTNFCQNSLLEQSVKLSFYY